MYTLKVNIRAQEERERRERERQAREALSKVQSLAGPSQPRKRKGLNFNEPGTYIAQGEQMRKKAKLEALQKKIAATAAKTGITDAVKLATLTTSRVLERKIDLKEEDEEQVPEVEWWDRLLIGNKPLDEIIPRLQVENPRLEDIFSGITNLVEHPLIKKAPGPDTSQVKLPIFLTKDERKKLRRQNRKNQELVKQEQIKLGLIPKPEPKLKRSNIMHVLGDEAIVNPSMAEQLVREQEEKRMQAHLEHNESKKLTLKEKRLKRVRKYQEDLNVTGVWVTVYRILSLNNQAHKFKVIQNAKQLNMTGVVVLHKNVNLVVVEGGPKQQRKFKHLMLERIPWSQDEIDDSIVSENPLCHINKCLLVWEGQVSGRSFMRGLKVKQMAEVSEARDFFRSFNVEHYWDLAFKMSILESIEDK